MSSPSGTPSSSAHNLPRFPNAPYLRTVALPEFTGSPARSSRSLPTPVQPNAVPGTSRSRLISLPAQQSGPDHFVYGLTPQPGTPRHPTLTIHPLLRATDQLASTLIYNVLSTPTMSGPRTIFAPSIPALTEHDLMQLAFSPPRPSTRIIIHLHPHPQAMAVQFPWVMTATSSRRVSAPTPGQGPANLTVFDILASLHIALLSPVGEHELTRFTAAQIDLAHGARARRLQATGVSNGHIGFVRSDFLGGCFSFAGVTTLADGQLIIRLTT